VKTFHRSLRTLLMLAPAFQLAAADAQPLAATTGDLATIRITGSALEPSRLALGSEARVVFRNDAAAMARVELELPRGEGLLCSTGREEPERGRKFVVARGDALECEAPAERTRFRVFRLAAGGSAPVASEGELQPAAP
jgi:hypothetical protein